MREIQAAVKNVKNRVLAIHASAPTQPEAVREYYLNQLTSRDPISHLTLAELLAENLSYLPGRREPVTLKKFSTFNFAPNGGYVCSDKVDVEHWFEAIAAKTRIPYGLIVRSSTIFGGRIFGYSNEYGPHKSIGFFIAIELAKLACELSNVGTAEHLAALALAAHLILMNTPHGRSSCNPLTYETVVKYQFPIAFPSELSLDQIEVFLSTLNETTILGFYAYRDLASWITHDRIFNYLLTIEKEQLDVRQYPMILALARDSEFQDYPGTITNKYVNSADFQTKTGVSANAFFDGRILPLVFNYSDGFNVSFGDRQLMLPGQTRVSSTLLTHFGLMQNGELNIEHPSILLDLLRVQKQGNKKKITVSNKIVNGQYCGELADLLRNYPSLFANKQVSSFLLDRCMDFLLNPENKLPPELLRYFVEHKDEFRTFVLKQIAKNPENAGRFQLCEQNKNPYTEIVNTFRAKPSFVPGCFYRQPAKTRTHKEITAAIAAATTNVSSSSGKTGEANYDCIKTPGCRGM